MQDASLLLPDLNLCEAMCLHTSDSSESVQGKRMAKTSCVDHNRLHIEYARAIVKLCKTSGSYLLVLV